MSVNCHILSSRMSPATRLMNAAIKPRVQTTEIDRVNLISSFFHLMRFNVVDVK